MTFRNRPGGFRRWRRLGAHVGTGFRKRKRQLRARWRPARGTPKKPDVLHPAGAAHQHLSLSRQRPLLATAAECRAGTKLVEFDDRISELPSNIDEARRHRDLKLRGVRTKPLERSVHRLNLPSRQVRLFGKRKPRVPIAFSLTCPRKSGRERYFSTTSVTIASLQR